MGVIASLHDPQDRKRALERIRKLWNDGNVEILQHAQDRMAERNFDVHDVRQIIEHGKISEISRPHDLWRYKISGRSVENKRAACVVELNDRLIIVTVVDLTRARKANGEPS